VQGTISIGGKAAPLATPLSGNDIIHNEAHFVVSNIKIFLFNSEIIYSANKHQPPFLRKRNTYMLYTSLLKNYIAANKPCIR